MAAFDDLLLGDDEPTAVVALADAVAEAAATGGVDVANVQVDVEAGRGRASDPAGLLRARLRAELTGSGEDLAITLAWLEEAPPLLAVRELIVTQLDVRGASHLPERLRMTLVVEGLIRPRPAPRGTTAAASERALSEPTTASGPSPSGES